MNSFQEMLQTYSVRNSDKVKKVLEPLIVNFGVTWFHYHRVNNDGSFYFLNYPTDVAGYYFETAKYLLCPFLLHPYRMRAGLMFWEQQTWESSELVNQYLSTHYNSSKVPVYVEKDAEGYHVFEWCLEDSNSLFFDLLTSEFPLMKSYFSHFLKALHSVIAKQQDNPINLDVEMVGYFRKSFDFQRGMPVEARESVMQVLNEKSSFKEFSSRELQCIELYRSGYTARDTAKSLNLSSRTVEYYFENIKSKLGCESKKDILKRIFT